VTAAAVVVRGGLLGGPGARLAQTLMERGLHVLQEHPLHADELADCLRAARRHGVTYRLNSFYVHTEPVRRFVAAARELLARQSLRYLDASCGFQVAYALLDIVGQTVGGVRPWGFTGPADLPPEVRKLTGLRFPFRSLDGVFAGVPMTLRVQNQLDPGDPDNYAHLLHRVTLGTDGGSLTLVGTHGPTIWSPRPDFPHDVRDEAGTTPHFGADTGPVRDHLDLSSAGVLDDAPASSYREIFRELWPAGVRRAMWELREAALSGADPLQAGQYHLTLCRLWQDLTTRLGPPELVTGDPARPLQPDDLAAVSRAAGG
jgi:pyochelin biosynthetic protein PchG